jgi:molybdopterin/thiamine biosynthesis adenylyltransferase
LYPNADKSPNQPALARILVVGAGALGCAAARTLAQEPRTSLTIVDDDRVELSNLQRQVLYVDADIGRLKTDAAAERLATEFGAVIATRAIRFDPATGPALVADVDLVLDATDDPDTKFLIGRLCVAAGKPYVYGGVARTGGQWLLAVPGKSACLECVYPAEASETAAGCAALGILAPVAGVVGSMQALTALAYLRRPERATPGRLHIFELGGARSRHIDFHPDPACFCSAAFGNEARTDAPAARRSAAAATRTAS